MHTNTSKIIKILNKIAPQELAESWDNVGLLVGNRNKMVENILIALEVTEEIVKEAISKNVDLIITHHPLIFKPLKKINTDDKISEMVIDLIKNDINLFVAHTNLDSSDVGTNEFLAELFEFENIKLLDVNYVTDYYKVVVTVPTDDGDKVRKAMTKAGGGHVGNYSDCTFNSSGITTFRPIEDADPHIGEIGKLEEVEEVKIETIVNKSNLDNLLSSMIKAHPYEVVGHDVIKLENHIEKNGVGRVGNLNSNMNLKELAELVKEKLNCDNIKVIGDLDKKIRKVSVVSGAGSDYFRVAASKSDVLITGDVKYHEAHYANQLGLCVIDAGHFETENIFMKRFKNILENEFENKSYDINIYLSDVNINPFKVL